MTRARDPGAIGEHGHTGNRHVRSSAVGHTRLLHPVQLRPVQLRPVQLCLAQLTQEPWAYTTLSHRLRHRSVPREPHVDMSAPGYPQPAAQPAAEGANAAPQPVPRSPADPLTDAMHI